MVDAVGISGLVLGSTSEGFKVIKVIIEWVQDSKAFGSDTRIIKTRLLTTSARLETLTSFLHEDTTTGARINKMSDIQQTAILGMIRELDILFASYQEAIRSNKLDELITGLTIESTKPSTVSFPDQIKAAAVGEARHVQSEAGRKKALLWGLFRKKEVVRLISSLERWNDTLMQFLICCLTFGGQKGTPEESVLCAGCSLSGAALGKTPGIRVAITLKQLLENQTAAGQDLIKPDWVLQPIKQANDDRLKTLIVDGQKATVFVEYKPVEIPRRATEALNRAKIRACTLGQQLSLSDATSSGFYALRCIGIIQQDRPTGFAFIFELPHTVNNFSSDITVGDSGNPSQSRIDRTQQQVPSLPVSLSTAIASSSYVRPTLNEKLRLAANLTRTCRQFHGVRWLHKSIRSQNILLFPHSTAEPKAGPKDLPHLQYSRPYLAGFEFSRSEKHHSEVESDDDLARNLYRAPGRWGLPEARFSILDDLYALGVTLLEVGIWRPLIRFEDHFQDMTPEEVKTCLIQHASQRLPHYMGVEYTQAVLKCLRGDFGSTDEQTSQAVDGRVMSVPESDEINLNTLVNDEVIAKLEAGVQPE